MSILEKIATLRDKFRTAVDLARREFWDKYQENGERINYDYAFACWEEKPFIPYHELGTFDHPIECANYMFYNAMVKNVGTITLCDEAEAYSMFAHAVRMHTAHIIILGALTDCEDIFTNCQWLANLTIEGKIVADINFQWSSELTEASLISIVNSLEDLYDAGEEFEYTVYFSENAMDILSATNLLNVLDEKGWNY